jgi:mono/diheme cytochrome c family protein
LNDPLFWAIVPDSILKDVIRHGRPGTLMTSFGGDAWNALSEQQIGVLVSQMRARWGGDKQVPKDAPPYLAPDSNDGHRGDPAAGDKLLTEICGSCHGKDGRGGSVAGSIRSSAFLALISDQALRRIVITGRPDRGMPDYEDLGDFRTPGRPLTSDEVGDIVALLASWREPDDRPLEASSTGEPPSAATK